MSVCVCTCKYITKIFRHICTVHVHVHVCICVCMCLFLSLSIYLLAHLSIHPYLIGKIPLRHLVYRVLDLPPSMRPLVYDFGQLNLDTEKDYIRQIVWDRCQNIFQDRSAYSTTCTLVKSIAQVLAWSQKYMRERMVK